MRKRVGARKNSKGRVRTKRSGRVQRTRRVCWLACELGELVTKHLNQFPGKRGIGPVNEMLIWWRGRMLLRLLEVSPDATSKK